MASSSERPHFEAVMDFEKIRRSMEFVLAQQAQFVADLQQSREESDRRYAQVSEALTGAMAFGGILAESDRQVGRRLAEVATVQKELGEAQKVTEASLSALMLTVERHLREDHSNDGRDQP
jgi:phage shock protein A